MREASQLASEAWTLAESIGDPTLTVGLYMPLIHAKGESGEWGDVLRWSQRAIDLADGDPSKGNFLFGCPLASGFIGRAIARYCLGRPGWRDDQQHGLTMARSADPCPTPRLSPGSTTRGCCMACCDPTTPRWARSWMPYGSPNDPVTTSRWHS